MKSHNSSYWYRSLYWPVCSVIIIAFTMTGTLALDAIDSGNTELVTPEIRSRLIRDYRKDIHDVSIAKGTALKERERAGAADYAITGIIKGAFPSNIVIFFDEGTLQTGLPDLAILVLNRPSHDTKYFDALGQEAWRGIIPYSDEKWEELQHADLTQLAQNVPEKRLPLDVAISQLENTVLSEEIPPDVLSTYRYDVMRLGYGWYVVPLSPTKDESVWEARGFFLVHDDLMVVERTLLSEYVKIMPDGTVFYSP